MKDVKDIIKGIDKIDFKDPKFIEKFEKADEESEKIVESAKRHTPKDLNYIYY